MKRTELVENIFRKGSFLCVGLDPDPARMPASLGADANPAAAILAFNKAIIDATAPYCVAYIRKNYPDQFVIADAKRGDIGNTAARYARTFFDTMDCHAVTLAPYMGEDSVRPFLDHADRWSIVLALTSNPSAGNFETIADAEGMPLYQRVVRLSRHWGSPVNTMYVVGATRPESLVELRKLVPRHFFLVPGVGAQGGNLEQVVENGMIDECGLLVNSSRGIIHASSGDDFAEAAAAAAREMAERMAGYLAAIER